MACPQGKLNPQLWVCCVIQDAFPLTPYVPVCPLQEELLEFDLPLFAGVEHRPIQQSRTVLYKGGAAPLNLQSRNLAVVHQMNVHVCMGVWTF